MKHLKTSLVMLLFLTVALGGLYPLLVAGIGAAVFPRQAGGSLIEERGRIVGSALIGQDFTSERYFHPRPSAVGYDASSSGASNLGYTSAELKKEYEQRLAEWRKQNPAAPAAPPVEMLFASGSGLDPDISPSSAEAQVARVAAARHLSEMQAAGLLGLVRSCEIGPQLGFLGEPRVNVLALNLALDRAYP